MLVQSFNRKAWNSSSHTVHHMILGSDASAVYINRWSYCTLCLMHIHKQIFKSRSCHCYYFSCSKKSELLCSMLRTSWQIESESILDGGHHEQHIYIFGQFYAIHIYIYTHCISYINIGSLSSTKKIPKFVEKGVLKPQSCCSFVLSSWMLDMLVFRN